MHFLIYRDRKKEWRWKLLARNGRNIANAGESYQRRSKCVRMIDRIRLNAPKATVIESD